MTKKALNVSQWVEKRKDVAKELWLLHYPDDWAHWGRLDRHDSTYNRYLDLAEQELAARGFVKV